MTPMKHFIMVDDSFWIVTWGLTVLLCLYKIVEALLVPRRLLEWPFLACMMWSYFFGYMAFMSKMNLSAYLGNGMADIGQLMALLCLIGILAGWSLGMRIRFFKTQDRTVYPYLFITCLGLLFMVVGAVGNYSVSHVEGEGELNYRTASAYWYLLFYVGYPGMAMALWASLKMKAPACYFFVAISLAALVVFLIPQVLTARRGPLFPAIMILLLVPPLTLRRQPNRLVYLGGLVAVGAVMLTFLQVRSVIYTGGSWSDAFRQIDVQSAVAERGEDAADNEYVNNCQVIGTLYDNGKYQYGTGYLELLVHWVPHALWLQKPGLGEGYYSNIEMYDDIERATGVRLLGNGAAWGGVADSFIQFGVLCPFFWMIISTIIGALYSAIIRTRSPLLMFIYAGICCATQWHISQIFPAAFVPGMFFISVPVAVWAGLWLYRKWAVPTIKLRPRRVVSVQPSAQAL